MIDPTIFRGSDIRGEVARQITPATAELLGRAYGTYVLDAGQMSIVVGHDNRPSSMPLADAFAAGVSATGCNVIELGCVPTPTLYFAATRRDHSFAAMITASHLPASSNGFKFCRGSQVLFGTMLDRIQQLATDEQFAVGTGTREYKPGIAEDYVREVAARLQVAEHDCTIVVDAQNGAASLLGPTLLERLGFKVLRLHCDLKQPYPFERPDPQDVANLGPLQKLVVDSGAAVGIAFDGDADRMGVVDERGQYVPADQIMALFVRAMLAERPGAKVVVDVLTSQLVTDEVTRQHGTPILWKSGHAFIKEKLQEEQAVFAGESSGHIFFADRYFGFDDGLYAAGRLLELLANDGRSLSALTQSLPKMFTSTEERPPCPDALKFRIVDEARIAFEQQGYALITIDGVRIQFAGGWGLVRASNTEPVLSLRFEAGTESDLASYRLIVWDRIIDIGRRYNISFTRN